MPFYFGYTSNTKKPVATVVDIDGKSYEPAEPSKVKIFPMISAFSIITSIWASVVALFVAAVSKPIGTQIAFSEEGVLCDVIENKLPLRSVGLAFSLKKGITLDQELEEEISLKGFQTMSFNRGTVYFKDNAKKVDYEWVDENVTGIDEFRPMPNRFLSPESFKAVLILTNITSAICLALHHACIGLADDLKGKGESILQATYDKFPSSLEFDEEMEEGEVPAETSKGKDKTTKETGTEKMTETLWSGFMGDIVKFSTDKFLGYWTPTAVVNEMLETRPCYIQSGDETKITSHGLIMKFVPALAVPDPNMIGDVLAKYFMRLLGETQEEQHAMLIAIKKGASFLKLTRLGDELAHLYRCIELSIEARCGMVPFFTGFSYEGSVLMGGEGCILSWPANDCILTALSMKDLKEEFKGVSSHSMALENIASKFEESKRAAVKGCHSMRDLRALCLNEKMSAEDVEHVIGHASNLTFESENHWVVNPANIAKAMRIISGDLPLTGEIPITRHCLFSKDLVLIGLSVFGEKSVPSWNIPSGTFKSLKGSIPQAPAPSDKEKRKVVNGMISDVDWTMVVRRTDLKTAVDDFRELVKKRSYRTSTSFLAKKQGYFAFDPKRMGEFWKEMQAAYRKVDPMFIPDAGGATISKESRKRERESTETVEKRAMKKMKF